jgi:8-oxo-dGTP diphosphatase
LDQVRVLVGALAVDGGDVLVLRRSEREKYLPGRWGIPAGKVETGEDLEHAVLRELWEEAGLTATVERVAGSVWFDSIMDGHPLKNLQVNYVVRPASRYVRLDHSNNDSAWVPLVDLSHSPVELDGFTRGIMERAFRPA